MPELPDVEYFCKYLKSTALHQKIKSVRCGDSYVFKDTDYRALGRVLGAETLDDAYRRGKFLIIETSNEPWKLVLHFGMTGYLKYLKTINSKPDHHAHLIIKFKNGYELRWFNQRKIGQVKLVKDICEVPLIRDMGPEPFALEEEAFLDLLEDHEIKNIKSFFMDQTDIAGIGNEYSDEILFKAGIDPHRKIEDLSEKERKNLYKVMQKTLKRAIKLQPPKSGLTRTWLISHRDDLKCPKGDHKLKKEKIAGRSGIWCPKHQK